MTRLSMIQTFFDSSAQTPTKRRRPASHHRPMALESLEVKRLLAVTAPQIFVADDASALTAAFEAPGFRAVMPLPSGGGVVAAGSFKGSQGDDFTLVQYRTDGTLDTTFSGDGIVQTNFSSGGNSKARHDTLWGAGMDSQGRIVVSGQDNQGDLIVARYTSSGTLDNTFSGDGMDRPGSSASLDASMQTVAFDAADNVYIAGEWQDELFRVVKYKASGILDAGFGVNGVFTRQVEERVASSGDRPNNRTVSIAVYESSPGVENILLSGTVNTQTVNGDPTRMAAVLRLNLDGSLDSTFDDDGIVTTNVPYNGNPTHNNYGNGIAADNQGRILIAGMSSHGMNVIRYNSDGSLDTSFNASGLGSDMPGVVVINSPSEAPLQRITRGRDLALDEVGRIVVGGTYKQNPSSGVEGVSDGDSFVVARLNPDGTLDSEFGTGGSGVFELLVGAGANELTDVTIASNGDIWAAGLACADTAGCDSYGSGQPFESVLLKFSFDKTVFGDFDKSHELDAPDIDDLTVQVAGGDNDLTYDLNADDAVNLADITVWIKDLKNSWIGDANLDGEFSSTDLVTVLSAGKFGLDVDSVWSSGDFNGDKRTNSADLVAALSDGGFGLGVRAAVSSP